MLEPNNNCWQPYARKNKASQHRDVNTKKKNLLADFFSHGQIKKKNAIH